MISECDKTSINADLAIIIPAWKTEYLRESIESIAAQSDQRFQLYLFDDASPHDMESVLKTAKLPDHTIIRRFDENLGQASLVKQWNRCIENTNNEPWIWLFSDDDIMTPGCVAAFYQWKQTYPGYAAYRFNSYKMGADGEIIRENMFPDETDATTFLNLKLSYTQESYVVESIFSRKAYQKTGGFPEMPLAWAADDLFNLKLALHGKIRTLPEERVYWRYSAANISGGKNRMNARLKMKASGMFVKWIYSHARLRNSLKPANLPVLWYVRQIRSLQSQLTLTDEWRAVARMLADDKSVLKAYLKMKKDRSKLFGWLKKFS